MKVSKYDVVYSHTCAWVGVVQCFIVIFFPIDIVAWFSSSFFPTEMNSHMRVLSY